MPETAAATPVPTVAKPAVTLNRSLPPVTLIEPPSPSVGSPLASSEPPPDLTSAAPPLASDSAPSNVVLLDCATESVVPLATLTVATPLPEIVPERLFTDWLLFKLTRELTPLAAFTTSGPALSVPVGVVTRVPAETRVWPV